MTTKGSSFRWKRPIFTATLLVLGVLNSRLQLLLMTTRLARMMRTRRRACSQCRPPNTPSKACVRRHVLVVKANGPTTRVSFERFRFMKYKLIGAVKSKLINKAIQDIGMGSYNWQ